MQAYVINLKQRTDRWKSVVSQDSSLSIPLTRVEAVNMDALKVSNLFVAPGVAATWKSHQLAMSVFLDSKDEYGLILEDDFLLTKKWKPDILYQVTHLNPDYFQLGYLITSPLDRIDLWFRNQFDILLKILAYSCKFSKLAHRKFGDRLLIKEQKDVSWNIVPNNIRAGGQAYLVSRKFALAAQHMNSPAFTSTDGMFMALGDVRSFRMFRFRKSLIDQTGSATSVAQRFL